jgi:hypothetical protein
MHGGEFRKLRGRKMVEKEKEHKVRKQMKKLWSLERLENGIGKSEPVFFY